MFAKQDGQASRPQRRHIQLLEKMDVIQVSVKQVRNGLRRIERSRLPTARRTDLAFTRPANDLGQAEVLHLLLQDRQ